MEICVKNVSVTFGSNCVLSNTSLEIRSGSWVSIVGSSGSGKSTLLNMLCGIIEPDQGTILVGHENSGVFRRRVCAYLQQDFPLYPSLSARENISLAVRKQYQNRGVSLDELIDLLRIEPLLARLPSELSGGERQRVAIARTLMLHRPVLLLDEPFSNIDALHRKTIRAYVRSITKKWEQTVILVSHDHEDAISTSDYIGIIDSRTLLQYDTPQVVFQRPASIAAGQVFGDVGMIVIAITLFPAILPADASAEKDDVFIGVRETDFDVFFESADGSIRATVSADEFLGSRRRLFVHHGAITLSIVVSADSEWHKKKYIWIRPMRGRYILFKNRLPVNANSMTTTN